MPVSEDDVRRALAAVPAPDGRGTLAASPALSPIVVADGRVAFAILTTPEQAPRLESLRRAAEAAVKALPGVGEVLVSLTAERAAPAARPPQSHRPAEAPLLGAGIRHMVAVASGKGGVGKSTVAANLALALARQGHAVGLLDADIFGPSAPTLFALKQKPESDGRRLKPLAAHGIRLMSIGFLVDPEVAMIWRGPMVVSALTQMIRDVEWGPLDVLVIDMPPGTGDVQLTLAQQTRLAGAVIVSTPQDLALADARRGVAMFRKVDVPILGLIENMSYFVCPHCGGRSEIFGHGGAAAEAAKLGVPMLGDIPLDPEIRATSDAGTPVVATAPDGPHARAFLDIAEALWSRLEGGALRRPPPRIVME
ncbi:MAG TPA: Mrp/NBP35 family ATP-binding protein [Hyphomicrobiales bacterium]|nr:Mrp/NBP35 family ATP-binding protein [Hyphomicrobiales bacterium]